jgi:alpha-glucosidase (family GH31 glycosyl hydrolase)
MLGESMLIAPVTQPSSSENLFVRKQIFLPRFASNSNSDSSSDDSSDWIEWVSLSSLPSGQHVTRDYSMDDIPIFVKAGSIIPMLWFNSASKNLQEAPQDPLVLSIFPGPKAQSGIRFRNSLLES